MNPQTQTVTVEKFYTEHAAQLGLHLLAGATGLKRIIREPTVNRPGLALAGFKKYFAPRRVQVIGNVETAYLKTLEPELRLRRYRELFGARIPCIVLCRGIKPDRQFLNAAEAAEVPVLQTGLVTMKFINLATLALEALFAPRTQVHGSMVDIQGIGVVIQGESGIGKSEAVLGLLERGYCLVTDDITRITLVDGREIMGTGKEITRNLMEVRGIGIIDVAAMFGVAAIRAEKRVDLVVVLKAWEKIEEVDRLGLEERHTEMLGIKIPCMEIPVRPGRDTARLIEVAAFQTRLRNSGINPARELSRRMTQAMQGI
jgi:HPr kinase/phosphorylase